MAKTQRNEEVQQVENTEQAAPALTPIPTITQTAAVSSQSGVVLPGGERRADYIKRRYLAGAKPGLIAKELTVIQEKKIQYQTVFQITKKFKGTPQEQVHKDNAAKAEMAAANAAAEASAGEGESQG